LLENNVDDVLANLDGKSVYPIIVTPYFSTTTFFSVNSQFPPVSAAKSTITLP